MAKKKEPVLVTLTVSVTLRKHDAAELVSLLKEAISDGPESVYSLEHRPATNNESAGFILRHCDGGHSQG